MDNILHTLETNHLLHSVGIGVITTMVLKNRTDKNVLIGLGVSGGLYWYMTNYGHSMPCMYDCHHSDNTDYTNTVYNNPRELMNSYSATY